MEDDQKLSEKEIRYENMLFSILQTEEKIEPFLDSIFKFLSRRTDFFLIQENPQQSFGFPKGAAKQILMRIFDKYNKADSKAEVQKSIEDIKKVEEKKVSVKKSIEEPIPPPTPTLHPTPINEGNNDLKKKQEYFQKCPESYNGAIRDKYSWSQSIKDLDVKIKVKSNIIKSKDVKIKIEKQYLLVQVKNDLNNWDSLVDDKLAWKIRPEESTWSLFPGDHIHVNLEKVEERWWENLIENEEKLDIKNINPEKPMHDLEPEAQAKIQQLMYDQHRKQLNLPTSEEEKYQDMLKKAWNAEGSPFAGTPFDPSRISIEGGNVSIK